MHLKPFSLLPSASLWSLCGFLLTSQGVARADQASDIQALLQAFNRFLGQYENTITSDGYGIYTVPYGSDSEASEAYQALGDMLQHFLMYEGYWPEGAIGAIGSTLSARMLPLLQTIAANTNSVDLSMVEDSLSAIDGGATLIYGAIESDLPHLHMDVEDILRYLQANVNGASRDVYQNDVTNSLKDLGTSLDALAEVFRNGFYGQGNSSPPSSPGQPPPSSDIPAPLADQLYAHSFTVDIDETQVRTAFDNTQLGSADHRFVFWSGIGLGGFSIPNAVLDMGGSEISLAADALAKICRTVYWLMYYLAIFFLVRREYTYYASLGHTSEGAN